MPKLTAFAKLPRLPWSSRQTVSWWTLTKAFLPSILWAAVIFLFSAQGDLPSLSLPGYDFFLKKFAHVFVYAVLYWLVLWGFRQTVPRSHQKLHFFGPVIICLLYALSDEFHQSLTPGRSPTLRDVGYDMLGVWIVLLKEWKYF